MVEIVTSTGKHKSNSNFFSRSNALNGNCPCKSANKRTPKDQTSALQAWYGLLANISGQAYSTEPKNELRVELQSELAHNPKSIILIFEFFH